MFWGNVVTIDIAAGVTRGITWPDGALNTQPGSAIILSAEDDDEDTIRPRLRVAGANLDKVHILQAVRHAKDGGGTSLDHFSLAVDIVHLQDAVAKLEDVRLVIIDPISAYLGKTDSHKNASVRGLLAPLIHIAQTLRFSIIRLDHLSKASDRPALYRPNGSIAFTAAARAVWFFAKHPDDPVQRLMLPGKSNLAKEQQGLSYTLEEGEPDVVVVKWGGPVSITADDVMKPEDVEERSERMDAMEWIKNQLAGGPVAAPAIWKAAKEAGHAEKTLKRAKKALGVISDKGAFNEGWSWRLPEEGHDTSKEATSNTWPSSPQVAPLDSKGYTPESQAVTESVTRNAPCDRVTAPAGGIRKKAIKGEV